jgi:hypothetical protein
LDASGVARLVEEWADPGVVVQAVEICGCSQVSLDFHEAPEESVVEGFGHVEETLPGQHFVVSYYRYNIY